MSEQGWRAILEAEGVEDWVVLHGGPTAAPASWILAERAGNKVCIAAWPDGAADPQDPGPPGPAPRSVNDGGDVDADGQARA